MAEKSKMLLIFLLMLTTALIFYYIYMTTQSKQSTTTTKSSNIENFADPTTTTIPEICKPFIPSPETSTQPISVISKYYGVGLNISNVTPVTDGYSFILHYLPNVYEQTQGLVFAVVNDRLTLKIRNDTDTSQYWKMIKNSTEDFYMIQPDASPDLALSYENGTIALRPKNTDVQSQKWNTSNKEITQGIPILNSQPSSIFTSEFDAYAASANMSTDSSSLTDQNNKQVKAALDLITAGINQYLNKSTSTQTSTNQLTSSSFGNSDNPINVKVSLGSGVDTTSSISKSTFGDVGNDTAADNSILSLLAKYDSSVASSKSYSPYAYDYVYRPSDLDKVLTGQESLCKNININDYTNRRVGQCNCKL